MNLQTIIELIDTQPESKEYTITFDLPGCHDVTLVCDDRQRLKDMATMLHNHHKKDVRLSHEVDDLSHARRV